MLKTLDTIQQKFGLDRAVFLCYNTTVKRPNRADKF